jgi:DNA helicase HerA-like ATPase
VIDLNGITGSSSLQRFVVATILRQIVDERTGPNAINGLVYLVALDELNRFAPRGSKDSITQLIEQVAAEMRSQGIILLGAQQQASKISERVFENSAIKVVGRSGSLEMGQTIWKFMSEASRKRAANLQADEKLIIQDTFREPMLVAVPFPAWAMRPAEVSIPTPEDVTLDSNGEPEIIL